MTNLKDLLYSIGYTKLKDYGRQYSTKPLYRDSDNETALTINKDTGEWFDFVERIGGPIETLVEKTLGRPLTPDLKDKLGSEEFLPLRRTEIELEHQKTFDKSLLVNLHDDHSYWDGRGIGKEVVSRFGGGVAVNGRMRNRYVFPIFNERGDVVGFSGRYLYLSEFVAKWKHLGQKTGWVYPLFSKTEIVKTRTVILVESIGDMLALYDAGIYNVLVTFGVYLGPAIIKFLLQMDVDRIVIALNDDREKKSVGNKAAAKMRQLLLNYFDERQVSINLPLKKDFGVMKRDEILLWKTQSQI
jgi:hypothetical protein